MLRGALAGVGRAFCSRGRQSVPFHDRRHRDACHESPKWRTDPEQRYVRERHGKRDEGACLIAERPPESIL